MSELGDPGQGHWRIEASGESITEDPSTGSLVLRLGMAVNSIRAAQRFFEAAKDAPGPGGERDRFWAFLVAVGFLNEALQVLRPNYPKVRVLAETGGVPGADIEEAGELLSGRRPINKLLDRIRNRLVFHWDDELVREYIAGFSKETVGWAEGIGQSNGEMFYRASADVIGNSVLPAVGGEGASGAEDVEGIRNLIQGVARATKPVLSVFEHAIIGHISAFGPSRLRA